MILEISGVDCVVNSDHIETMVVDANKEDFSIYHENGFTYVSNDTNGNTIVIKEGTLKIKMK